MMAIECRQVSLWDGGERHNFGFYITKDTADEEIRRTYPRCLITTKVITVFDTLQEVKANNNLELRKSAWRKLTPIERAALNMIEEPK